MENETRRRTPDAGVPSGGYVNVQLYYRGIALVLLGQESAVECPYSQMEIRRSGCCSTSGAAALPSSRTRRSREEGKEAFIDAELRVGPKKLKLLALNVRSNYSKALRSENEGFMG